ncbi:LCP family protein [Streptosporangium sp. NPDC004379]|uniref:LCP family protein n=1 Tax=Streptosporangium sp. NPDC004379 TaxID=3366189 RepID=UPI0036ACD1DB
MDDLTMLRDLGRDLEHEPPATLTHQRRRLLGAASRPQRTSRMFPAARPLRTLRVTRGWAALGLAAAVTAAAAVAVPVVLRAYGFQAAVGDPSVTAPEGRRPPAADGTLDILFVGTDSEAFNPRYKGNIGDRSDTMLLIHLPAGRKKATVVSFPRDSIVRIPSCRASGGKSVPARTGMINSAYTEGGLNCAWKTVESLTGIRVDHAMETDFSGFAKLVDALGGVEVTLPRAVDDPKAKVKLPAGRQTLDGRAALGYARIRYTLGDGSDLIRVQRQQGLMAALVKKAEKLTGDPAKLAGFLTEARRWVRTDPGFDAETMLSVAASLRTVKPGDVEFVIVPVHQHPADVNRLQWNARASERLFAGLRKK